MCFSLCTAQTRPRGGVPGVNDHAGIHTHGPLMCASARYRGGGAVRPADGTAMPTNGRVGATGVGGAVGPTVSMRFSLPSRNAIFCSVVIVLCHGAHGPLTIRRTFHPRAPVRTSHMAAQCPANDRLERRTLAVCSLPCAARAPPAAAASLAWRCALQSRAHAPGSFYVSEARAR